jgi:predicted metalloprotease with PDZ domain
MNPSLRAAAVSAATVTVPALLPAQQRAPAAAPRSVPVSNLRYEVTFDSATARRNVIAVAVSFDVAEQGLVLLSLPSWTPGSYEISNFARFVSGFSPKAADKPLDWDKLDYDTWRIDPAGARSVTVRFDCHAVTLDNSAAWSQADFAFVNGTNIFPYPEGRGFEFPATVTVKTQPGWLVATGMEPGGAAGTYRESNYHDLVDKPFFIGRFDVDSQQVEGHWHRLVTYPAGAMSGPARSLIWDQIEKTVPRMAAVFRETPWRTYSTLMVFTREVGGGSALEHSNSHLGIYNPGFVGNPLLASITDHEIFHAWNVKRLRPADMWPYDYSRPQPTPWLWVSEGITDYYADLALVRGGVVDSAGFLSLTDQKMQQIAEEPPTALEDASLTTWISPMDGSRYQYYPKGSLAGFMLDVLIRDASDNRRSLDDVFRELYGAAYKKGRGFTGKDWWAAVSRAAAGRSPSSTTSTSMAASRSPGPTSCRGPDSAPSPTRCASREWGSEPARTRAAPSWCRRCSLEAWRRRPGSKWETNSSLSATSRSWIRASGRRSAHDSASARGTASQSGCSAARTRLRCTAR